MNQIKNILALLLYYTGISYLLFRITNHAGVIRAINYHCTPALDVRNFEIQLKFYKRYFRDISHSDLSKLLNVGGENKLRKPGIIISFDDGLRSNFDYALPLLEKYKFTGWFFLPVGFVLNPSEDFANDHSIICRQKYPEGRYGLSLDELKIITAKHVIGCHTFSHHRMDKVDSSEILKFEIFESKITLEKIIQIPVETFCWVGGELGSYTTAAHTAVKEAGYQFSFTTNNKVISKKNDPLNLNRTNIESNYSLPLMLFQLCGLMDILYLIKRFKVALKFSANDSN